jgi:DHA1 family bicyclomycin/chloramphenicol resistance-like MFS transporter
MPSYARNALILGLLAAIGPFAIDMYLPALPTIAAMLHASTAATQATLISYFVGFGASQLVYGPVSDMFGRKRPLYVGLILFIASSIGCALAPTIEWLIFFRFIQGIGGASTVMTRAIVRDLHTGIEATKLMSLIMLVFSVSPILAPITGSALIVPFGWHAVFVAVAILAALGLLMIMLALPETRPPLLRVKSELHEVAAGYGRLLCDLRFLGLTFIGGFGMASFFTFLASSSFIYIDHFGLTPTLYSFAFSVNAVGFIGASQFSAVLGARFGMARVISVAVSAYAFSSVALFFMVLLGADSLLILIPMLFITFAFLGLVLPTSMVLALEEYGEIAGMAASLGGTLQMVAGGTMIAVVSLFFNGTPLPMVSTIALCAVVAFTLSRLTLRPREWIAKARIAEQ